MSGKVSQTHPKVEGIVRSLGGRKGGNLVFKTVHEVSKPMMGCGVSRRAMVANGGGGK